MKSEVRGAPRMKTYLLVQGGSAILCLRCGLRSFNANDIQERYCGHCHQFHVEPAGVNEPGIFKGEP